MAASARAEAAISSQSHVPAGAKKSIALHGASARAPLEASGDAVGYLPWYELDFRASVHVSSLIHRDGLRAAADCEKISPRLERLVIHRIGPIFCMRRFIKALCIRSDWARSIRAGSSGGSSRPNSASREFAEFVYRVAVAKGLLDSTQAVTSSASLGSLKGLNNQLLPC